MQTYYANQKSIILLLYHFSFWSLHMLELLIISIILYLDWKVSELEEKKEETLLCEFLFSLITNYFNPLTILSNVFLSIFLVGNIKNLLLLDLEETSSSLLVVFLLPIFVGLCACFLIIDSLIISVLELVDKISLCVSIQIRFLQVL